MNEFVAAKIFTVKEFSTEQMYYRIEIAFNGKVVEVIERPTQREALRDFELAGYRRVACLK